MTQPRLSVVDLRHDTQEPDTLTRFHSECVAGRVSGSDDICSAIGSDRLHALCFEYDFPNIPTLMLLKETKIAQPSIPVVMITREHSEALAVWALRTGIWDYFVDPVPDCDLRNCLDALAQLPLHSVYDHQRRMLKRSCPLPLETRFRDTEESASDVDLDRAFEYVERNFSHKINQSSVARDCGMSVWQFSRQFKKRFGTTFQEHVQRRRILEARKMLKNPSASVTDVCFTVGFVDPSYFSRVFRQYVGISPSGYKEHLEDLHAALNTSGAPLTAK